MKNGRIGHTTKRGNVLVLAVEFPLPIPTLTDKNPSSMLDDRGKTTADIDTVMHYL